MPPKLTDQLVHHLQAFEQGVQQWPQESLVGHITAVEKKEGASNPADFRPITVLTLPYRTWASIRAKECLRFLDQWADEGLRGNRPEQSTSTIWWQISQEIEASVFAGATLP